MMSLTSSNSKLMFATLVLTVMNVCPSALASTPTQPARTVISNDVHHINARLTANYGKLGGEYQALQSQTDGVQAAANADAKAQNGRLTPIQVATFNKELTQINHLVTDAEKLGAPSGTWMANHPAAAKVLNSAESINAELSKDYGSLGGHYVSLELQDGQIRAAAQNLAKEDNGLSAAQVTNFNNELTNLQTQINQDFQ